MSVQTQIDRLSGNVSAALNAISQKGVTVPATANSDDLEELISVIETGTPETWTLTLEDGSTVEKVVYVK